MRMRLLWPGMVLFLAALLTGCGDDGTPPPVNNPVPSVTSLSPTSATAGDAALTLTVNGSNFLASSVVHWNGSPRPTLFVDSTSLEAAIPATDLATTGTAQVTVFNPAPGGGTSNSLSFTITNPPAPTLTSLSPESATAGDPALTLTVNGLNFLASSVVRWNGLDRATTFVSSTQLTAAIPDTDLTVADTAQVTVFNPAPGGGTSNSLPFTITNPVPSVTSLSPSSATAGDAALTLMVNGSGFVSNSVVRCNDADRTTTFVSSTKLEAAISADDLATPGTVPVTVVNPTPGGGTSNSLPFTINDPAPTLSSLSPESATVGDPGLVLTVNGSDFLAASVVCWNGSPRTTTFVSSSQLTASIPGTDLAVAGTAEVTVCGEVSALTFTIINPVPALTAISPSSVTAGDPALTLTANGSDFVSDSVVRWNGANRTTTFGSSSQLTASIPDTDLASSGTAQVTVFNPAPGGGTSGAQTFTINAPSPGVIERVSVASDGAQGNDGSRDPKVSADGRFVAFSSRATNLVGGDTNGSGDIFVRDTCLGATGCTPSTIRASVAGDGSQSSTGAGIFSSISADGRYAAFETNAGNMVPGDTNGTNDVFVRGTCAGVTGCTPSTIRVSVASNGTEGNGVSFLPSISADGRFVSFRSEASNLVAGDTNGTWDIFVRDTCVGATGCTPSTIRVSVANDGTQGNSSSFNNSISANGRYVAFRSNASNLVAGDTNLAQDMFVRDTCAGATGCTPSTIRVSVASDGTQGSGGTGSPTISADGRFVAFATGAPLVAGDTNGFEDVYVRDTCAGTTGCTPSTIRASVAANGAEGADESFQTSISAGGRFVAFLSFVSTFVAGDTNNTFDVFIARTGF